MYSLSGRPCYTVSENKLRSVGRQTENEGKHNWSVARTLHATKDQRYFLSTRAATIRLAASQSTVSPAACPCVSLTELIRENHSQWNVLPHGPNQLTMQGLEYRVTTLVILHLALQWIQPEQRLRWVVGIFHPAQVTSQERFLLPLC